jgi:hypothetical protein
MVCLIFQPYHIIIHFFIAKSLFQCLVLIQKTFSNIFSNRIFLTIQSTADPEVSHVGLQSFSSFLQFVGLPR